LTLSPLLVTKNHAKIWRFVFNEISFQLIGLQITIAIIQTWKKQHCSVLQFFWRAHKISKSSYWLRHVCPQGTSQLPLDGFSWNLIFEYFSKICLEYSSFIKIWQESSVLYMTTNVHFLSYLAHFFFEWQNIQTKIVKNIKTHFVFSNFFFNPAVYEIMWNSIVGPDRPQITIWRMRIACRITKATNAHSEYVILIASPFQQLLREGASVLVIRTLPVFFFHSSFLFLICEVLLLMLEENITQTSCLYIYTEWYITNTKDKKLNFMKILIYIYIYIYKVL
jgi:hypothetical protein